MADSKMYSFSFEMDDEYKAFIKERYPVDSIADGSEFKAIKNRIAGNEKLEKELEFIYSFSRIVENQGDYPLKKDEENGKDINKSSLSVSRDKEGNEHLLYTMKNLEGTGLSFAIEDGKSIVLADQNSMSKEQLRALFKFLDTHCIGEVNFPAGLRSLALEGEEADNLTVGDYWQQLADEDDGIRPPENDNEHGTGAGESPYEDVDGVDISNPENQDIWGQPAKAEGKKMNPSLRAMRKKVQARMNIMGFNNNKLLTTRYNWDGSVTICAYNTEDELKEDGKNSKGKIKRTKAFAVKLKIVNGVPCVWYYLPQGKPLETKHAQCILEAIKATGAEYFSVPPATETGGAGQNAFWEACGKTMMVPLTQSANNPNGADLGPDNVKTMLDMIGKEDKQDIDAVISFKEKLLEQLQAQEDYKLQKNPHHQTNSKLATIMGQLEGAVAFQKFNDGYLTNLNKQIGKMAAQGATSKEGWDTIEVQAAYRAAVEVVNFINEKDEYGRLKHPYGGTKEQKAALDELFAKKMTEHKQQLAESYNQDIKAGKRSKDILAEMRTGTRGMVDEVRADLKESYGMDIALAATSVNVGGKLENDKQYNPSKPHLPYQPRAVGNGEQTSTKDKPSLMGLYQQKNRQMRA